ncbi:MAG: PadR family transcriptional regulator [Candidatus Thorarchaeota archaeon]|jgi:DNA-binding PadR family transcriptional regulator
MKPARSELIRKILLELNRSPSSIYDILYSMTGYADPRRTRLPKLLKAMENEGLVVSALQPGPLGPYRRIYEIGPAAEAHLRESLKNSIETILHFYNSYRQENPQKLYSFAEENHNRRLRGRILYAAFPHIKTIDLEIIRDLLLSSDETSISTVGSDLVLQKTGISYDVVGDDIANLSVESKTFSEIHLHGVPKMNRLPSAIAECKRVLTRKGQLRILTPFAFFDEPQKPTLGEFIRITSSELFPELGIVEGNQISRVLRHYFPNSGLYETSLGEVVFHATKS